MKARKYVWDVSLLRKMKRVLEKDGTLNVECKKADIKTIDEMIEIAQGKKEFEHYSFHERVQKVEENYHVVRMLDISQKQQLEILRTSFEKIPFIKTNGRDFTIEDILSLLEEFIKWFPDQTLAQFFKIYYDRDFKTHFYYCSKKVSTLYCGSIYLFHYFNVPFVLVTKETFVETFVTLIHELGHFLIYVLNLNFSQSRCGCLFSELDGKYFEGLARTFLIEKGLYVKESINSSIGSYNDFNIFLEKLSTCNLWKTFWTYESSNELLCEIYSYLGSLELLDRYNGDYEKQLHDLLVTSRIQSDDLGEYLNVSGFEWRQNDYKVLCKHIEKMK